MKYCILAVACLLLVSGVAAESVSCQYSFCAEGTFCNTTSGTCDDKKAGGEYCDWWEDVECEYGCDFGGVCMYGCDELCDEATHWCNVSLVGAECIAKGELGEPCDYFDYLDDQCLSGNCDLVEDTCERTPPPPSTSFGISCAANALGIDGGITNCSTVDPCEGQSEDDCVETHSSDFGGRCSKRNVLNSFSGQGCDDFICDTIEEVGECCTHDLFQKVICAPKGQDFGAAQTVTEDDFKDCNKQCTFITFSGATSLMTNAVSVTVLGLLLSVVM